MYVYMHNNIFSFIVVSSSILYLFVKEKNAQKDIEEFGVLKEDVSGLLINGTPEVCAEKLDLVDTIQRLGIDYHFDKEIRTLLQRLHDTYDDFNVKHGKNLYIVSLSFRLLRQQGYRVSCGMSFIVIYFLHYYY